MAGAALLAVDGHLLALHLEDLPLAGGHLGQPVPVRIIIELEFNLK
jgi:hypothetical protein